MKEHFQNVTSRIQNACAKAGRPTSAVEVVAVSKRVPAERIEEAHKLGITNFGENYLQEALPKQEQLRDLEVTWHFIGQLQSNKLKKIGENFSYVHSVGTLAHLQKLSALERSSDRALRVFLEINLADESTKAGWTLKQFEREADSCFALGGLEIVGLMTMPPLGGNESTTRSYFSQLYQLSVRYDLSYLSMGTSEDFEWAIQEGATHVRLGTALFGPRSP